MEFLKKHGPTALIFAGGTLAVMALAGSKGTITKVGASLVAGFAVAYGASKVG